jgi:hypothetical protein
VNEQNTGTTLIALIVSALITLTIALVAFGGLPH